MVTTVEGILRRTVDGLMQDQPVRRHMAPEDAAKIDEYVAKIEGLLTAETPFFVVSINNSIISITNMASN